MRGKRGRMRFLNDKRIIFTLILFISALAYTFTAEAAEKYSVQSGDTLWGLSRMWGVSVDSIKIQNNLDSDNLKLGQTLIKPDGSVTPARKKVSRGGYRSIADIARNFMGVRYVYAGRSPSGFDCSGFTSYVYGLNGLRLPHVAAGQYNMGSSISRSSLESGDLVFFNNGGGISHVGIYVGSNQFIHASTSRGVRIDSLNDSYWGPRYAGARRVM